MIAGTPRKLDDTTWSKLRSARERFAALNMLDYMLEKARSNLLRVDVITWDVEDSRHKIQGRSDIRNLRRMYYFLFKDVLGKRWPAEAIWQIYPDESSTNPWSHLGYLTEVWDWNTYEMIFEVNLSDIIPSKSHEEPIQVSLVRQTWKDAAYYSGLMSSARIIKWV